MEQPLRADRNGAASRSSCRTTSAGPPPASVSASEPSSGAVGDGRARAPARRTTVRAEVRDGQRDRAERGRRVDRRACRDPVATSALTATSLHRAGALARDTGQPAEQLGQGLELLSEKRSTNSRRTPATCERMPCAGFHSRRPSVGVGHARVVQAGVTLDQATADEAIDQRVIPSESASCARPRRHRQMASSACARNRSTS